MNRLPDAVFIIDVRKEEIAVAEASRLGIPIVAVVDTNCSPEGIDYVIPGNDDALRAVRLFASRISEAILEGQQIATEGAVVAESASEEAAGSAEATTPSPEVTEEIALAPATEAEPQPNSGGDNSQGVMAGPVAGPGAANDSVESTSESEQDEGAESVVAAS